MRIITRKRLKEAGHKHAKAKTTLEHWEEITSGAAWRHLADVKATFAHADQVRVSSGRPVVVFNIGDNFRLIAAIHFNTQIVYVLTVLPHAEYSKGAWKAQF